MYIKCDYCKTSIERFLSEHGNDSFQITIHCSTCIQFHGFTLQHLSVWIFKKFDFWCYNATFNNISSISLGPVSVVEEAGEPPTMGKQLVNFITCKSSAPFLAHLAKGHVSFCHHLVSVVRRKHEKSSDRSTIKRNR